ncbi:HDIG domain-containing protein [bacterium]|nr:HDIG domain-containing protein [bacterium]
MNRSEALLILNQNLSQDALLKHSLATESIMRALALCLGENPDRWGQIGLLHDLDFEITREDMSRHGRETINILSSHLDKEAQNAILSHNEETGIARTGKLDFALASAESITGLIVATALVYPDKKIASVKSSSVVKRMKQPAFARAVSRENIRLCEKIGLSLEQFVELSLKAMSMISSELGL